MITKKILLFICTVTLNCFILFNNVASAAPITDFKDVKENDYYYIPFLWATSQNIMSGLTSDTFGGNETITRGQIVTALWSIKGRPASSTISNPFTDLQEDEDLIDAVLWAVEEGIIYGTTQSTFSPDDVCTRAALVTILWRACGSPSMEHLQNPFEDVKNSSYYYDAVLWACENNITSGKTNTTFAPYELCDRAQSITFMWRTFKDNGETVINACDYGLSQVDSGTQNSKILQGLIDYFAERHATIYIPAGEYNFAVNGTQSIGTHCIKMRSNISIKGDGDSTVLKPIGHSAHGLDMFYFNDYVDYWTPNFLENCRFEDFVIDSAYTIAHTYTSAGKGFMFNLIRNCHWKNITVRNTDATGFGVDCPIDCSIIDCTVINCGKALKSAGEGAAGFGIGFGYSAKENMLISNCVSIGNKKFGFFFEHQGRFAPHLYKATSFKGFTIDSCEASGNYYNFGGIQSMNMTIENCSSIEAISHGYFLENARNCRVVQCESTHETNASFVILQSGSDGGKQEVSNVFFEGCKSFGSKYGAIVKNQYSFRTLRKSGINNCFFDNCELYDIVTFGTIKDFDLTNNTATLNQNDLKGNLRGFNNTNNSWNE